MKSPMLSQNYLYNILDGVGSDKAEQVSAALMDGRLALEEIQSHLATTAGSYTSLTLYNKTVGVEQFAKLAHHTFSLHDDPEEYGIANETAKLFAEQAEQLCHMANTMRKAIGARLEQQNQRSADDDSAARYARTAVAVKILAKIYAGSQEYVSDPATFCASTCFQVLFDEMELTEKEIATLPALEFIKHMDEAVYSERVRFARRLLIMLQNEALAR